jgi:hypothetical protein
MSPVLGAEVCYSPTFYFDQPGCAGNRYVYGWAHASAKYVAETGAVFSTGSQTPAQVTARSFISAQPPGWQPCANVAFAPQSLKLLTATGEQATPHGTWEFAVEMR